MTINLKSRNKFQTNEKYVFLNVNSSNKLTNNFQKKKI